MNLQLHPISVIGFKSPTSVSKCDISLVKKIKKKSLGVLQKIKKWLLI